MKQRRKAGEPHNIRIGSATWDACLALAVADKRAVADVVRLLLDHALEHPPQAWAAFLRQHAQAAKQKGTP